jgi:hypothetical protein
MWTTSLKAQVGDSSPCLLGTPRDVKAWHDHTCSTISIARQEICGGSSPYSLHSLCSWVHVGLICRCSAPTVTSLGNEKASTISACENWRCRPLPFQGGCKPGGQGGQQRSHSRKQHDSRAVGYAGEESSHRCGHTQAAGQCLAPLVSICLQCMRAVEGGSLASAGQSRISVKCSQAQHWLFAMYLGPACVSHLKLSMPQCTTPAAFPIHMQRPRYPPSPPRWGAALPPGRMTQKTVALLSWRPGSYGAARAGMVSSLSSTALLFLALTSHRHGRRVVTRLDAHSAMLHSQQTVCGPAQALGACVVSAGAMCETNSLDLIPQPIRRRKSAPQLPRSIPPLAALAPPVLPDGVPMPDVDLDVDYESLIKPHMGRCLVSAPAALAFRSCFWTLL